MAFGELMRRYAWPLRTKIALIVVFAFAANLLALANPAIVAAALALFATMQGGGEAAAGGSLDLNSLGQRLLAALPLPAGEQPGLVFALLGLAYLGQTCATAALNYGAALYALHVRTEASRRIRADLLRHLFALPLSFFHRERSGELLSRVTHDAQSIGQGFGPLVRSLIHQNIQLVGYAAYLLWTDARLTGIVVAVIGSHFGVSQLLRRRMRRTSREVADRQAALSAALQESLTSVRVAKSFGAEEWEIAKLERAVSDSADAQMAEGRVQRIEEPVRLVLDALAVLGVFAFAAVQLRAGRLTFEGLILYVYVARLLIAPANHVATYYLWIQSMLASFDRIRELLSLRSTVVDGSVVKTTLETSIELRSVTFSYDGQRALDDVSLEIRRGEMVALVGASGAGKSTLTDLVLRLHDPDSGQVLIDGIDVRSLVQSAYRRPFGVVSQETLLFNDTVANNIRYGRNWIGDEAIVRAAKTANAHEFVMRLPQGYDTAVGDRGVRLSGGERQRIAIARAVVHDPEILVFDEATSALDSESERQVQTAIDRVTAGITSIIVAHRLSTVRHADKIVVMDRGRIVDCGRHDELLARCPYYVRLCELQHGPPPARVSA